MERSPCQPSWTSIIPALSKSSKMACGECNLRFTRVAFMHLTSSTTGPLATSLPPCRRFVHTSRALPSSLYFLLALTWAFSMSFGPAWKPIENPPPLDAWYPEEQHKQKHYIDLEHYTQAADRPVVQRKTKISFRDHDEYVTVLGFGNLYEHEYHPDLVNAVEDVQIPLRLVTIPRAGNRRYLGFLSLPTDQRLELRQGDSMRIVFDVDNEYVKWYLAWFATVTDPIAITPPGSTTILLTRRWDQETGWHELSPDLEPHALDVSSIPQPQQALIQIIAQEPQMIKIKVIRSEVPFRRQMRALREMETLRPSLKQLLLSNDLSTLPQVDMYEGIQEDMESWLVSVGFNDKQLEAFRALRHLPGGVGIFQGPPGTGKTFWLVHVLLPVISEVLEDAAKFRQVMLIGPSNDVVDHLAVTMQSLIDRLHPNQGLVVTRCHSMGTEEALAWEPAARQRPVPDNARPPIIDTADEDDALLDSLLTAKLIADLHAAQTAQPAGVPDARVKHSELSVGHRMLQLSGIVPCSWSEHETYSIFREQFNQYRAGYEFDGPTLAKFRRWTRELRNQALARSNVVVTTPFTVGATPIRENVHPTVVAVDEAARLSEPELWPVLAWLQPRSLLLVGDHQQLRPLIFSQVSNNPFSPQLSISLFARLKLNGLMDVMFNEQHRMVSELGNMVSSVFYGSQLHTARELEARVRQARHVVDGYNRQTFRKPGPLVFVNVPDSADDRDARQRSTINKPNCAVVYALVRDLLTQTTLSPGMVTVLTPYRGQLGLYRSLFRASAQIQGVRIHTIDSFQGRESMVVVLDITACTRLMFLGDPNRLNVAVSRARAALYVVGGWKPLVDPRSDDRLFLRKIMSIKRLVEYIRTNHLRVRLPDRFRSDIEAATRQL